MDDGFLADDGIPAVRRAVDVVEVADRQFDSLAEAGFISRGAGTFDTVRRDVDAAGVTAHPRKRPKRAAETAGDIEHPFAGADAGTFEQVLRNGRGGFRHGFPARHVAADMDVGAAPAGLVEPGYGLVVVIGCSLSAVEYCPRHDFLRRSRNRPSTP
jgi:hypothetical protein